MKIHKKHLDKLTVQCHGYTRLLVTHTALLLIWLLSTCLFLITAAPAYNLTPHNHSLSGLESGYRLLNLSAHLGEACKSPVIILHCIPILSFITQPISFVLFCCPHPVDYITCILTMTLSPVCYPHLVKRNYCLSAICFILTCIHPSCLLSVKSCLGSLTIVSESGISMTEGQTNINHGPGRTQSVQGSCGYSSPCTFHSWIHKHLHHTPKHFFSTCLCQ